MTRHQSPGKALQRHAPSRPLLTSPPGLAVPGKPASVVQSGPDRAGNFSAASWDSAGASTSSPDSDSGPDLTTATESDNPYNVHIHFSGSMEEEFHGMGIRAMDDDDELEGLDAIAPGVWDGPMAAATWETNDTGGWDDNAALDAEDQWRQNQEPTTKPILCNAHGIICKKGICAEYARQLRLNKRAKEAEDRKAAAANRGKKGGRGRGRGANKNDENENEDRPFGRNVAPNQFRGPGAPVKTNWRGAPRNIVSADVIERREATKAPSDDGWGNSDSEVDPNAAAVTSGPADTASDWDVPNDAFDPWATPAQPEPGAKANGSGGKPQGKKKPLTGQTSSDWADQVDAEMAASGDADTFSTVSSKPRSKRGTSTTSWGASAAKSSTSGWGSVPDMPF